MSVPQGLFIFQGIEHELSATYTMTPGVSPGIIRIALAPQYRGMKGEGDCIIAYGGTRIRLRDCRVDKVKSRRDPSGFLVWTASILDRRWKWKGFGAISGRYNIKRNNSDEIDNPKTPSELFKLCFAALGERRIDTSKVSDDTQPMVEWDYEKPAVAAQNLATKLGYVIVLRLDNRVVILPENYGTAMPSKARAIEYETTFDPPESPSEVVVVGGRTRIQSDISLEPVGIEADGSVKPIDDLSYAPELPADADINAGPWSYCDPKFFAAVADPAKRQLAETSVWRMYRIRSEGKGLRTPYGYIEDMSRILPLDTQQVEQWTITDGAGVERKESRPPWIYGTWYNYAEGGEPYVPTPEPNLELKPDGYYPYPFAVDPKRGIVTFRDPVFRQEADGVNGGMINLPALLRLRIAFGLRDKDTGGSNRFEHRHKVSGQRSNTPPAYRIFPDLILKWYYDTVKEKTQYNEAALIKQARKYVVSMLRDYEEKSPAVALYPGLIPVDCTGAIKQVTWQVARDGSCSTRVARQIEESTLSISESERQWFAAQNRRKPETPQEIRVAVEDDL